MKKVMVACTLFASLGVAGAVVRDKPAEPMIVHNVFFTLVDNSASAKNEFTAACKKFLASHEGTVYFAAGPRFEQFKRSVNDLEFDVALTIVFKNQAAHDKYQDSDRHQAFVKEWTPKMKKVRVFDSLATE
jgi:hypothetical protein